MHVFAFKSRALYLLALATTSFDLPFSPPKSFVLFEVTPLGLLPPLSPPVPPVVLGVIWTKALCLPHSSVCTLLLSHPPLPQVLIPFVLFIQLGSLLPLLRLQGNTIESEHLSELTEEEYEAHIYQRQDLKGFMWLDAKYLNPFFTRRLTQEVSGENVGITG